MYKIKTNKMTYTMPKDNLMCFAKFQAVNRKESFIVPAIVNDETAKQYLKTIGIEVEENDTQPTV